MKIAFRMEGRVNWQFLAACYLRSMQKFSRENYLTDVLATIGLMLIGVAVYLQFGVPAALAYAGAALLAAAAVLAILPVRKEQP